MSAYREFASRPNRHTSKSIRGTVCDNCPCMEVIPRHRRWYQYEEYFCSRRHAMVDPHETECRKR